MSVLICKKFGPKSYEEFMNVSNMIFDYACALKNNESYDKVI